MRKTKEYARTKFPADVLRKAHGRFLALAEKVPEHLRSHSYSVRCGNEKWHYDSIEQFLAAYRTGCDYFRLSEIAGIFDVEIATDLDGTSVSVSASSSPDIATVFEEFDAVAERYFEPLPEPAITVHKPVVFIGHGHSPLWRDLKDHLHEQHGYDVEAYETGSRAGHSIRDILEQMLGNSAFALLVLTGEDDTTEGTKRARQNVIHETGLFQGRLGFARAIVLLEEGTEDFSNLAGVHQIRFSRGKIKETYGDVLATLEREFPRVYATRRNSAAA